MPFSSRLTVSLPLVLVCVSLFSSCATTNQGEKDIETQVVDAKVEFYKAKIKVQAAAEDVKDYYEKREKDENYEDAEDLYFEARLSTSVWTNTLADSVESGMNPAKSKSYNENARAAQLLSEEFQACAERIEDGKRCLKEGVESAESLKNQVKKLKMTKQKGWGQAIVVLFEAGLDIWEAYSQYAEKQRKELAEELRGDFAWPEWEDIPA